VASDHSAAEPKERTIERERQEKAQVKPNRSNAESQIKKFNRCTLNVRDLPLERFRLQRDGQKWKQAARSRFDLLLKLSTYANPDGTFESEDGKKNFSPSAKTLLRHYAKRSLYRLTNDLCQLGLLSWEREKNHYGRRTYRIHFQHEKQVPHSQNQVPDSQKTGATTAPDNRCHDGHCYQMPDSPELTQNTGLVAADLAVLRLLEPLPSSRRAAAVVDHHHPEPKFDDDHNNRRRERQHLRATALSRFRKKYGNEFDPRELEQRMDGIEKRADATGTRIMSAEYFEAGLENEARKMVAAKAMASEQVRAPEWTNENSDLEKVISFWGDKLIKSGVVTAEKVREKMLEFLNENGFFASLKKRRDFLALIPTNVFPNTPEPREGGRKIYFPKRIDKIFELASYAEPEYMWDRILITTVNYLQCLDEFQEPKQRRAFEDRIAYNHEQKKSDEGRARYRKGKTRRDRELRSERNAKRTAQDNLADVSAAGVREV
jgi:hypothetical protein